VRCTLISCSAVCYVQGGFNFGSVNEILKYSIKIRWKLICTTLLWYKLYYNVEDYSNFCVKLNLFGSAFLYSCWSCSFQGRKTKLSSFDVEKTYYNKAVTRLNLSFFRHYRRNSEKFLSTPKVDTLWRGENTSGGLATRLSKTGRGLLDNKGFISSS